jgi:5-methylcytosine-specific restriction enzyme subunit McrC
MPVNTPRQIVLREWTPWSGDLSLDDASRLAREASHILDVDIDRSGAIVVRPLSYVGRVAVGGFDVRIVPKVPIESVLAFLAEAFDLVDFNPSASMGQHDTIENLIVRAFLSEVDRLLMSGLHRVYVDQRDELLALRGRVDVRTTTDLFLRGIPRVACTFEEFSTNNIENQVLLAAVIAVTANASIISSYRAAAARLERDLSGVDVQRVDVDGIAQLGRDVRTKHYRRALGLADLILRAMGFHERHGTWRSSGFLVDMNKLFETLLTRRLTALLRPQGIEVERQVRTTLDFGEEVDIRPDMVLRAHSGRRLVVDAKYKVDPTPSQADLYQMVAYCRAMDVEDAVLIDVASAPAHHIVIRDGVTVIHALHVELTSLAALTESVTRVGGTLAGMLGFRTSPLESLRT